MLLAAWACASSACTRPGDRVATGPWQYSLNDDEQASWEDVDRPWIKAPPGQREAWFRSPLPTHLSDPLLYVGRTPRPFDVDCDGTPLYRAEAGRRDAPVHWIDLHPCAGKHYVRIHVPSRTRNYLGLWPLVAVGDRWAIFLHVFVKDGPAATLALAFILAGLVAFVAHGMWIGARRPPYLAFGALTCVIGLQSLSRNSLSAIVLGSAGSLTAVCILTPLIKGVEALYLAHVFTGRRAVRALRISSALFFVIVGALAVDALLELGHWSGLLEVEDAAQFVYHLFVATLSVRMLLRSTGAMRLAALGLLFFKISVLYEAAFVFFGAFGWMFLSDYGFAGWMAFLLISLVLRTRDLKQADNQARIEATRAHAIAQTTQMFAHDVRRPFAVMRMALAELESAANMAEVRAALEVAAPEVQETAQAVEGMIEDILEVGSKAAPAREPHEVRELIASALASVARAENTWEVDLSYALAHTRQLHVHRGRVERVISNLVCNAVQAMRGRGAIWLRSRDVRREGLDFVELTVGNSGSSIPAEHLPKLFEPFFTAGKQNGTGLGLAIVKKVVEAHGGEVLCRSSENTGVEFIFSLPAWTAQAASAVALPDRLGGPRVAQAVAAAADAVGARVVLVEDSKAMRFSWSKMFPAGMLRMFESPAECLQALEAEPQLLANVDFVVLDNRFDAAEIDGFELGKILRRSTAAAILLCSGVEEPALPPCFDGQLPKLPHDLESLARAVRRPVSMAAFVDA